MIDEAMTAEVNQTLRKTDLRRADVEEAERLLTLADDSGVAPLPSLLAVDLCLFGGHRHAMFDESALATWAALTGSARERCGSEAFAELVRRKLVAREPSRKYGAEPTTRYRLHAAFAMILGARARPQWVAVCSVDSTTPTGPRMYGLGNALDPLRAAVMELPREPSAEQTIPSVADLGKIYDYTLASTSKAADLLAGWAMDVDAASGTEPRQIDVYHHPDGQPMTRLRLTVQGDERRARVSVGERGAELASGDYDRHALADHLDNVIRRFV